MVRETATKVTFGYLNTCSATAHQAVATFNFKHIMARTKIYAKEKKVFDLSKLTLFGIQDRTAILNVVNDGTVTRALTEVKR